MEVEEFKKEIIKQDIKNVPNISFLHEFTEILADKIIDDWSTQKIKDKIKIYETD